MNNTSTDIVILGAGYGGMMCVTRLSRMFRGDDRVRIHLVDRHTYHLLETRLHERAVREAEVVVPIARFLARRKNITFHLGEVTRIDLAQKRVELDFGRSETSDGTPRVVRYDHLVIALGSKTNFYQIPGLEEHAFQLKELEDSERIRAHTERMFAIAASESSLPKRKELLRIVIGGGGLTGVELATEIAQRFDALCEEFHIDPAEPEVVLLEASNRILPSLDGRQVIRSIEAMQAMGIQILTNTRVMGMEEQDGRLQVLRAPGEPLATRTMIWTGGIRISDLIRESGAETGTQGRVLVDDCLQLGDFPGVFAIGDNALAINPATGESVPTAAQFALQQGSLTADNLRRLVAGTPLKPYRPKVFGEVVSLGRHLAVGWAALPIGSRLRFLGFLGSLLKRAISERHLFFLWRERQNWTGHW
ncbi:MAG: NAD(P)/FAD-dependent oxidoreductase [Ignavibacteria bacterium]|nr:NAD(P)/FAD-dependent oxidoreductase [Ignavibacteria bacterium]